ncbi:MAG: cytidylate kinase-like family protein [Deltaproteobacteria bacterium]|nr:cytidylate kinase-like family protein [Deltaproteobacteria bacterium]
MSDRRLTPSVDHRLTAALEMRRRRQERGDPFRVVPPVVTLSREYGCEAFAVAERLQARLEEKTRSPWLLMEKALLEQLAKEYGLEAEGFDRIGERNSFFDDLVSVLSPKWKTDKDHYRVLAWQITDLAQDGNIIFIGRGASVLLRERKNTFHFRMVAPLEFRVESIGRRLGLGEADARKLVTTKQEQRAAFLREFLNIDGSDPCLYHLVFNNARNPVERMASIMDGLVPPAEG